MNGYYGSTMGMPVVCDLMKQKAEENKKSLNESLNEASTKNKKGLKNELKEIKPLADEYGYEYFSSMPFTNFDNDTTSLEFQYPEFFNICKSFFKEMEILTPEELNDQDALDDAWDSIDGHDFDTILGACDKLTSTRVNKRTGEKEEPLNNVQFEKEYKNGFDDGLKSDREMELDRKKEQQAQDELMADDTDELNENDNFKMLDYADINESLNEEVEFNDDSNRSGLNNGEGEYKLEIGYDVEGIDENGDTISLNPEEPGTYGGQVMFKTAKEAIEFAKTEPDALRVEKVGFETEGPGEHMIWDDLETVWPDDNMAPGKVVLDHDDNEYPGGVKGLDESLKENLDSNEIEHLAYMNNIHVVNSDGYTVFVENKRDVKKLHDLIMKNYPNADIEDSLDKDFGYGVSINSLGESKDASLDKESEDDDDDDMYDYPKDLGDYRGYWLSLDYDGGVNIYDPNGEWVDTADSEIGAKGEINELIDNPDGIEKDFVPEGDFVGKYKGFSIYKNDKENWLDIVNPDGKWAGLRDNMNQCRAWINEIIDRDVKPLTKKDLENNIYDDETDTMFDLKDVEEPLEEGISDNGVDVEFECEDCGNTWSEHYDKDYFTDDNDLQTLMDTSEIDCPECGGHARAIGADGVSIDEKLPEPWGPLN